MQNNISAIVLLYYRVASELINFCKGLYMMIIVIVPSSVMEARHFSIRKLAAFTPNLVPIFLSNGLALPPYNNSICKQ